MYPEIESEKLKVKNGIPKINNKPNNSRPKTKKEYRKPLYESGSTECD